MNLRHAVVIALVPAMALGACKKRPAVTTAPTPDATTESAADRARADSIRLANEREAAERDRAARDRVERERLARETAGAREVLTEIVFFEYDSNEITPTAAEILQLKAAVLQANPGIRLRVEGHADQRGSTEYNLALGQRRAEAVRRAFNLLGVADAQLEAVSFGKEKPAVPGMDENAWAQNRRAEIVYR
jgi:peptidoglycan-associated lipoprotein